MKGVFVNGVMKEGQGMTDFGYCTEERSIPDDVAGFEELVSENRAYMVEVFETATGGHHIRLKSDDRRIAAETKGKLETRGRGFNRSIYQSTDEPVMPKEYDDPHQAVQTYAEYALKHGKTYDIEMEDVNWDSILDEENQGI